MSYQKDFEKMEMIWEDLCSKFGDVEPSPCDVCEDWISKFNIIHLTTAYYLMHATRIEEKTILPWLMTQTEYDATLSKADILIGLNLTLTQLKCVWKNFVNEI